MVPAPKDIEEELENLRRKAMDALGRYKFWMFGYYASQWVKVCQVMGLRRPNPFADLVQFAKKEKDREG